jgi:RNA polymerase sigma factor (sigma-70 family)
VRLLRTPQAADESAALVERMATGDRLALSDLYDRYQGTLLAYLRLLTPDRGLAEEVVQDTLLAAWRGAGGFTGQGTVRSWLFGIARRRAADAVRRQVLHVVDAAALEFLPSPEPEPEAVAVAGASRSELVDALDRLSPVHREVLVLTFVHGLSHRELADVLGIPVGTVKSRMSNARRALRETLRAAYGDDR